MPLGENKSFPVAWSSKRTIKRMRRMGIVAPIDNARIDRIATAFVGDTNDARKEPQVHNAWALTLLEGTQKDDGPSVQDGLTLAPALRSDVDSIRANKADDKGRDIYVGNTYGGIDAHEPNRMYEVPDTTAAALSHSDHAFSAIAGSTNGQDLNGEATVTNSWKQVMSLQGNTAGKDSNGLITSATISHANGEKGGTSKTKNEGITMLTVSKPLDAPGNENKGPPVEVGNTVDDHDSHSGSDVYDITVATGISLSVEENVNRNGRDRRCYSASVAKKSVLPFAQNGTEHMMQAILMESIEKFSIGELDKEQGKVVLQSTKTGTGIGLMGEVVEVSPVAKDSHGAGHEKAVGEGSGLVCTANSKSCKKCCKKSLSLPE